MAGLARMANRDHRFVEIQPGDTVIVSASPIPGNEEYVARTIDNLFKAGANVFYHTIKRAHVSGHASQEELKLMLGLTRPRYFLPMHGEFRMQVQHGRLAVETGVAARRTSSSSRTASPSSSPPTARARRGTPVPAGYVFVDGLSVGRRRRDRAARPPRARERRDVHGRRDGRQADGHRASAGPRSSPAASSPLNENDPIMEGAVDRIIAAIENPGDHISEVALLKTQIKDGVSRYLYEQTKRRPMVFPVVVEV